MKAEDSSEALARYPLLDALRDRRSRRFEVGMCMESGPLAHQSTQPGLPLTEDEEAVLAFAACGITGYALADVAFEPGQGGTILSGLVGRTVPSGDAILERDGEPLYVLPPPMAGFFEFSMMRVRGDID